MLGEHPLAHRTLHEEPGRFAVRLPLGEELGLLHPGGDLPLVVDPRRVERACILGMTVLRPREEAWRPGLPLVDAARSARRATGWCHAVRGVGGAWPIADGDPFDAYRLALQYGLVDAVLVGSATVLDEGTDRGSRRGHLWQPSEVAAWPRLASAMPGLAGSIASLRRLWQSAGLLSERRRPAVVVVSESGATAEDGRDFLDAAVFDHRFEDGSAVEALVLTSEAGAERLAPRARRRGLASGRVLALSPPGRPSVLDVARAPAFLRARLDVRLANHDGGATVLRAFAAVGAVDQIHFTLMRGRSLREVLASTPRLGAAERRDVLASLASRAPFFFPGDGRLPDSLDVLQVLEGRGEATVFVVAPAGDAQGRHPGSVPAPEATATAALAGSGASVAGAACGAA